MGNIHKFLKLTLLFLFTGITATAQVTPSKEEPKSLEHTFYVAGNIGNDLTGEGQKILKAIVEASKKDKEATLLVPGNFLPPKGFAKNENERETQKQFLQNNLLNAVQEFNGTVDE